jgi:hypothetical protein
VRRWRKKLWLALCILLCGAALLVTPYDLYTAWRFHAIYAQGRAARLMGVHGWVSYEMHPAAFWSLLVFNVFVAVVLMVVAVFVVWQIRIERSVWRKRKAQPPVDDAIRQSMSER